MVLRINNRDHVAQSEIDSTFFWFIKLTQAHGNSKMTEMNGVESGHRNGWGSGVCAVHIIW